MTKSRTIFIWDVHWCFDELKLLLKKLKIQKKDKVYFVWDIISKWGKSFKVLKYIYKNKAQFRCVKWNNELKFTQWLDWKKLEKDEIKSAKKLKKQIIQKNSKFLIKYINDLPLYIEEKDFIVLHWWLKPNKDINKHTPYEITNLRNYKWKPWYEQYTWNKKIIYWHWAIEWLQIREKTIWLESWCVYWKALTAYILETGEVFQQTALKIHVNPYKKGSVLWNIKKLFKLN